MSATLSERAPRASIPRSAVLLGALALATGCGAPGVGGATIPELKTFAPREAPFDVEHYAIEIDLDPAARSISGLAKVRLYPRAKALRQVQLDFTDLEVRGVEDQHGTELRFEHAGGRLAVTLGEPLAPGDFVELSVRYDGVPRRGLYFTDLEDGVATQVFTQGECEDARGWFPCFDSPGERATSEVLVRMPATWTAVAAGERVERRETKDGRAMERWRMGTPHPTYLITLVAGEFATEVDEWDGIPLTYLSDPKLAGDLRRRFASTPKVLDFFSRMTGVRYPYAKYSQAVVANFPMGGMENISATTLTDQWLTDERGDLDSPAESLLAHEAAHQWFGNLVTCRDWSEIWLNEGWATYGAELYTEASAGREAFEAAMGDVRDSYLAADVGSARRPMLHASYREPFDLFVTGHAYPGGAVRLHQLRFELGDQAFFAGVRRYFADHRGKSVTSEDLRQSFEAASGRDLGPFFQQWFRERGYPELEVRWEWNEDARAVELEVEQVQSAGDGTPAAFTMPAEVELRLRNGDARTERIVLDGRRTRVRLEAPERPRWVCFDPHGWLVARVRSKKAPDEWLAIAQASAHPQPRREAVAVLGELARATHDARARAMYAQAIEERLSGDTSAAVRAAAARSLSGLAPAFGSLALQEAAASDSSSAVRIAALNGLAGWAGDERLAEFARAQYDACFSWATMGAAAMLYARAAPDAAFDHLHAQLEVESPHDVLAQALVFALGTLVDPRVPPALEELAFDPARSSDLRAAAVRALGPLARNRPATRRRIESLLSDDHFRLRQAAIDVLCALRDPRSEPAIRKAYPSLVDPRQKRALEAYLRSPTP